MLQVARCGPMNVLGGPLTILCLSAGHLLSINVVWQLQLACYCVPGCASVSPWAFAPFRTATKAESCNRRPLFFVKEGICVVLSSGVATRLLSTPL